MMTYLSTLASCGLQKEILVEFANFDSYGLKYVPSSFERVLKYLGKVSKPSSLALVNLMHTHYGFSLDEMRKTIPKWTRGAVSSSSVMALKPESLSKEELLQAAIDPLP